MLIPSSWFFVDLWLEVEQSIQSGWKMEQFLWVPGMNCSKHSKRWNMIRSRASYKKMEQIADSMAQQPPGASHIGRVWEHQVGSARTILEGLMKSHSHSLNDESLRTLMAELILRLLSVETISDSKRENQFPQVTSLWWKQVLSCLHQVNLANQMHTQKGDGDMCSILQENFGADGERNFSRVYK